MTYELRKEKVKELLAENEVVSKRQLEETLGVSPSTVQRDLISMEKEGILARLWGGARRVKDKSIYKRKVEEGNISGPLKVIGELAASKVRDGELIFLGPGKTTLAMAENITAKNITVITNGIPQLEALSRRNINVFLLCGFFKEYSRSVVGRQTTKMLESYRFDKAFLGVHGFGADLVPLSGDEYEYDIKNICIRNARETYVLGDHSKFNRTAMYATPEELSVYLNIITDRQPEGIGKFVQEKQGYIWRRKGK
ncbi:MAG TPA: DeoR/GlpR transcriptional regulator [Candidatus Egerieimonas intestinavium]|uniref:DeoR/GlpR transcriptional regulator n=1 Tax=Candidatus Egerieimonas intestinavium TaxID=2840777 RepID=A0A9D1JGZ7_9FIRM|nr:DeoR/GlpR transcriptional regulator [Candidatus Egerieimonas intestinavium]